MKAKLEGNAWRYGANVDTDVIIPARYLTLTGRRSWRPTAWRTWTPGSVKAWNRET